MPTRPTIRTTAAASIRAARWCRRRWRRPSWRIATARACCARWRSATTSAPASSWRSGSAGAYGRPHSTHSLGGLFGAAAAAGALLGLDARAVRFQLSYAVQQASGLAYWMRDPDHIEKAFDFGGMPARNGVAAATMVAAGFTGVEDPLAGPAHLLRGVRRDAAARSPGRGPRQPVRDHAGLDQEMAVGLADPGGARCARGADARARHRRRTTSPSLTVRLPDDRIHLVDDRDVPNLCVQHLLAVLLLDGGARLRRGARPGAHARSGGPGAARGASGWCRMPS